MDNDRFRIGSAAVKIGAIAGVAGALLLGVTCSRAVAAVAGLDTMAWPTSAVVGTTFGASISIANTSSFPNATEGVTLNSILVTAACANSGSSGMCPAGFRDPGVFTVQSAVGSASTTSCAGTAFTVAAPDPTTGEVQLIPNALIMLAPASSPPAGRTCKINLTLHVNKLPANPDGGIPGVTNALSLATLRGSMSEAAGSASGAVQITVIASVDTVPPNTNITAGPTGTIAASVVSFGWTGTDNVTPPAGLVYAFRLDPLEATFSNFGAATSTMYSGLASGTYTFLVKARDQSGNEDPVPANRRFVVNTGGSTISSVTGNVILTFQGTTVSPTVGTVLLQGATLESGASAQVKGTCADGSHFTLGANSRVFFADSLCQPTKPTVVNLTKGQFALAASPLPLLSGSGVEAPLFGRGVSTPVSDAAGGTNGAEFSTEYDQFGRMGTAVTTVTDGTVAVTDVTAQVMTVLVGGEGNTITAEVPAVVASVLPASRSVQVGVAATAFATMINTGNIPVIVCQPTLVSNVPAAFNFQTTDPASNQVIGSPSTPVSIPPQGNQSFVFGLTATAPIPPTDIQLGFECGGTSAPVFAGLTTLLLTASATPVPDIVALAATAGTIPGTVTTGPGGAGVFVVAAINLGVTGTITMSADTGGVSLPVVIAVCQTDPNTSVCLAPADSSVTASVNAGATPTYGIFVAALGAIPFDPANNRIFVRFKDGADVIRGSTSVAVTTP